MINAVRALAWGILPTALLAALLATTGPSCKSTDPLLALPRLGPGGFNLVEDLPAVGTEGRSIRHLTFEADGLGPTWVAVSRPIQARPQPLPVIVVLAGARTHLDKLAELGDVGANVLVMLEYQLTRRENSELTFSALMHLARIRHEFLVVPAQVAALGAWIRGQPWASPQQVSLIGVSFGALCVPSTQAMARSQGRDFTHTVIAYGGAGIRSLVEHALRNDPAPWRWFWSRAAQTLLWAGDPSLYLHNMTGEKLLISAEGMDRYLSREAIDRLVEGTPEPKTVLRLAGGHIDGWKSRRTTETMRLALNWLAERGAANPPP